MKSITTCLGTFEKVRFSSFPNRHGDATGQPATRERHVDAEKPAFRRRLPPILIFSTRYQTDWNVTKCHACHAKLHDNLRGNIRKERFCGFPHRHGDATGQPATPDDARGCKKTSISYETSSNFDIFHTLSNRLEYHKVPRLPRKTT